MSNRSNRHIKVDPKVQEKTVFRLFVIVASIALLMVMILFFF